MSSCKSYCRLQVLSFGLALGLLWGVSVLLIGLSAMWYGWGAEMVKLIGAIYLGYQATWLGSLVGGLWGFLDAFLGGVIFAVLYNLFLRCFAKGNSCHVHTKPPQAG